MKRMMTKYRYLVMAMLTMTVAAGCDSSVEPGNHAAGVVFVREDGSEAARFIYRGSTTGNLTVILDGSATYRVRLVTETGELADLDGAEYSLDNVRTIIPTVATATLQGEDEIVLNGLLAENTTVWFDLKHGAHTEFEIRNIPVQVLAPV